MRWRKIRKIFLDHPYFEYKTDVMSRKEAERIFNSGFPTFEEMIEGAKKRFNLPLETWAGFDDVIALRASKKTHRNVFRQSNTTFNGFISRHKRLAIVCMAIILLISFFTLVPFGRALVADFFNMLIRVFDGRIEITNQNPDYDSFEYVNLIAEQYDQNNPGGSESGDNEPVYYPDIEHFVEKTGLEPVTIGTDWLKCQTIESIDDADLGMVLTVHYVTKDGLAVVETQSWGKGEDVSFRVKDAIYSKTSILGNKEFIYTTDLVDGSFMGTALLDNSLLTIGAEKGVDTDLLIKAIK